MTVAENMALGERGTYSPAAADAAVQELSARTGFALDPRALVGSLPVGAQQRVEIAKALARRARILILDEPTGVLAPAEVDDLLRWLRAFVAQGNAAVMITHKLREALDVADDVTILRRGSRVMSGPAGGASEASLTAAMIGADIERASSSPQPADRGAPIVFRADAVTLRDAQAVVRVRDATFEIASGEIVGIAAVEGSGQRELLRALAGRLSLSGGALVRPPVVGFVPEDRHGDAVLLDRSLAENVALRGLGGARGVIPWRAVRARTRALMTRFDVRADDADARMHALSGGNQQKLVLARELADSDDGVPVHGLVVENPTRGLDVRATAAVHDRLREAAERGAAVVFHASDLDEVLLLATRVLVVFDGTVRQMPLHRETIGRAMLGLAS
jgi:simple sugar transport system ATP-binding protein